MSDEVYVLRGGTITTVPARAFSEGVRNERLEAALQSLLVDHPDLIPGRQLRPGDDAPRFCLLEQEGELGGRWFADHAFVDQFGIATLVETKLFQNAESRRAVIGQVLEYGANALLEWGGGELRRRAEEYWRRRGRALDDVLTERLGVDSASVDEYWQLVEEKLAENRLRLIIAADVIRPEVRRIIEFLNAEMRNVEVLGLEIRSFAGDNEELVVFTSQVVGQTQRALDGKDAVARSNRLWAEADLADYFDDVAMTSPKRAGRLRQLWQAMRDAGVWKPSRARNATFASQAPNGTRLVSIQAGTPHWTYRDDFYGFDGGLALRDRMMSELRELRMADDSFQVGASKNLLRPIEDLSDTEFELFVRVATYRV